MYVCGMYFSFNPKSLFFNFLEFFYNLAQNIFLYDFGGKIQVPFRGLAYCIDSS